MGQVSERDVIVVGAGPAGATTATYLAQKGYDVLMLDRNEFPRDKACGDGIPAGAIEILMRLGMTEAIGESVGKGEFYRLDGMHLTSPKGTVLEAEFEKGKTGADSYVAPRVYFDHIIQEHAVKSGAEFCKAAVKGPLVEDGRVVGVQAQLNGHVEPVRAKVVVGADGVTSTITRNLRPEPLQHVAKHRAVAIRAYIHDLVEYPHMVEFFLYDEILPGYAWIFPTGEGEANVGLGMRLDHFRNKNHNLKKMLKDFLELPDIKKRLKRGGQVDGVRSWQLNFGSQKKLMHTFDGALLVGDAAGFINPLTGGGIHNALISAQLAGQTIEEAFAAGDFSREFLKRYDKMCREEMWKGMRNSYLIQRWLLRFPSMVDFLISRARENSAIAKTFLAKL